MAPYPLATTEKPYSKILLDRVLFILVHISIYFSQPVYVDGVSVDADKLDHVGTFEEDSAIYRLLLLSFYQNNTESLLVRY